MATSTMIGAGPGRGQGATEIGPQLAVHLRTFFPQESPDWEVVLAAARRLDEAGVDRLTVSDHVVFGERLEEYGRPEIGGRAGGKQPTDPDGAWLEPIATLAVIAGMTSRIRLGTNVALAALRRPVVLAKQATTIDVLSGARLDLGVGVGWQREEYDAAGLDFADRGRLLDHTLAVCEALWTQRRAAYDSPELNFEAIHMMPKPVDPGGVPVWVSGTVTKPVARRVARFGTGWIPWGPDADAPREGIARMREALAAVGHDASGLRVAIQVPVVAGPAGALDVERTLADVPELIEAGVTDVGVFLDPLTPIEDLRALVSAFRAAAGRLDGVAGKRTHDLRGGS